MGYIEQNLLPGEQVIYRARPHWGVFAGPVISLGIGLSFVACGLVLFSSQMGGRGVDEVGAAVGCLGIATALVLLSAMLGAARAIVTFLTTEFAVTDRRIIARKGLGGRRSLDLLLIQVESINVNQPLLGRALNYGTVTITGTGGTKESFPSIANPLELRRRVHAMIEDALHRRQEAYPR